MTTEIQSSLRPELPPFAKWLNRELGQQGVTPSDLATSLSIPTLTAHAWAKGENIPTRSTCNRLAQYLEVPYDAVLRLAGWP